MSAILVSCLGSDTAEVDGVEKTRTGIVDSNRK